tara:strand:+ start:166 stop:465 length:300 start_codon:yes stop_codon:yes gene_type:complete
MSKRVIREIDISSLKKISPERTISISLIVGSLALILIVLRLGPVSDYSRSFNRCIKTTQGFLSTVPGFRSVGQDGLEAMAVSLCNGSTPQQAEKASSPN